MRRARAVAVLIAIAFAVELVGCRRGPEPGSATSTGGAWFEEIAARAGITFVHTSGQTTKHLLPEIMGGGAALFDFDNDGFLDLYLVQSGSLETPRESAEREPSEREPFRRASGNRLYRNRGNGTFEDVTERANAGATGYGMGVTAGDFDNDGFTDLYVTNFGRNVLLRNDGHGHFVDVTEKAGVAGSGWSTSAAFVDYDADGWLDLFVTRYLNWTPAADVECYSLTGVPDYCSPASYDLPSPSALYHNNGDGTFTDVSARSGIAGAVGNGLGVVAGDFNGDGRIDLFVANDRTPNHLWLNQGGGRFQESALATGSALDQDGTAKSGMGVDAVDVDDDGDLDLLVVNLDGEADSFFRNRGTFFSDDTAAAGLRTASRPFTRFGAAFVDFDNDGYVDLFEANGRVGMQSERYSPDPYAEPSLLFRGLAGPRFEEVSPRGGVWRHRQRRRRRHRRRQPQRPPVPAAQHRQGARPLAHAARRRRARPRRDRRAGVDEGGGQDDPPRRSRRLQLPGQQRSARPRRPRRRDDRARGHGPLAGWEDASVRRPTSGSGHDVAALIVSRSAGLSVCQRPRGSPEGLRYVNLFISLPPPAACG